MTTNEAAERLLVHLDETADRRRAPTTRRLVDEALAAERRATVERIRNAMALAEIAVKEPGEPGFDAEMGIEGALEAFAVILDEEAAR